MPKISRAPRYCRQKEKGRSDRAYVKINGRRIALGTYGSPESRQRYADALKGEIKPTEAITTPAPTDPTVSMLMVSFLEYAVAKYGGEKATEVVHFKQAFKILRRTHGGILAKDFGPKAFKEMRLEMIAVGWSRRYIRDQTQRIKRFVGWGVSEELLPRDARHALDAVPGLTPGEFGARETPPVDPVPDEIVDLTLPYLPGPVADMVRIARHTGARPGEICQLAPQHVDRTADVWLFRPPRHKSQRKGKSRVIAIGPRAQTILAKYLFSTPCFGYTTASFRRAIHRACDRAFPHPTIDAKSKDLTRRQVEELRRWQSDHRWHPHQLRHTCATEIRELLGIEHAQQTLGHATVDITEHYAKAGQAKAIEAARRLG